MLKKIIKKLKKKKKRKQLRLEVEAPALQEQGLREVMLEEALKLVVARPASQPHQGRVLPSHRRPWRTNTSSWKLQRCD